MNRLLSFVRGTNVDWNDWQDTNNWFGQWPGLAFWSVCLSLFLSPSKTNELPSSSFIFSRASLASHFSSMIDQKIQKQKCNQTMCSIWRKAVTFFFIKLINCRKFQFLTDILTQMLFRERDCSFKKRTMCWVSMCWISLGLFLHFVFLFEAGENIGE